MYFFRSDPWYNKLMEVLVEMKGGWGSFENMDKALLTYAKPVFLLTAAKSMEISTKSTE